MREALLFIGICAMGAFIGYMSGYDFTTRNPAVGGFTFLVFLLSSAPMIIKYITGETK